jgi:nucleotide-binding universal stress UspA family protein
MKRILVPCDFEAPSQEAFNFALNIAAISGGEVFVLNVIDLPVVSESAYGVPQYAYSPELLADLKIEARKNFERLRKEYHGTVPVNFTSQQGPVRPVIREFIASQKIDLIIMGAHGSSRWEEFFIGSNTERIVRTSPVPVIAVRKAIDYLAVKHIVLPSKLELNQHHFMDKVKELQKFFHATLHVLFVNTPPNFKRDEESRAALNDFAKEYQLTDFTLDTRNDPYEEDGILQFATETKADMIAMATHGRRGLAHLFTGSIAEEVLVHSEFPLWTYKLNK